MSAKHSPAPWSITGGHEHPAGETFGIKDANGFWVAKVHPLNGAEDVARAEANARMMIAAPRMAAVLLKAMVEPVGDEWGCLGCHTWEEGEHYPGCELVAALKEAGVL